MEHEHRRWMYDRNHPNRCGLKEEFVEGVKGFIAHAKTLPEFRNEGTIRCPCVKCKCTKLLQPENVKDHLYSKGFRENYYMWTVHGENYCSVGDVHFQNLVSGESTQMENNVENSRLHEMVSDAFGFYPGVQSQQNVVEPPNDEAKRFYESLESASHPLYKDSMHSELSVAIRLLTIKSDWNISQAGMSTIIGLMCEVNPSINLPNDYYKAKKLVSKLGLSSTKIDCCENGCMLYYKDDAALEACKFCGLSRFKEVTNAKVKRAAREEAKRREEEDRQRDEEMRRKDAAFTRVTGDVESLKAQLNHLLASGVFPALRSPSRSNKTKE